jgi:hypothetical protein
MTVNTLEKLTLKFQAKIFLHGMGWYGNIRTPSYAEQMGIHLMALDDEYKAFAHAHPIPLYRPRPPRMQPVDVPGYGGEIIGIQSNKDGKWYLPKLYLAALDEWGGPLIPSPPKTDAEKLLHAIFNNDMDDDVFFEGPPFGKSKMGEIKGLLDTVDGIANPTENAFPFYPKYDTEGDPTSIHPEGKKLPNPTPGEAVLQFPDGKVFKFQGVFTQHSDNHISFTPDPDQLSIPDNAHFVDVSVNPPPNKTGSFNIELYNPDDSKIDVEMTMSYEPVDPKHWPQNQPWWHTQHLPKNERDLPDFDFYQYDDPDPYFD